MNYEDKSSVVQIERQGVIGKIILNRPEKRNAMSEVMWAAIPDAVQTLDMDPEIRVIILTSSTHEAFSAGADIGELEVIANDPDRRESNQQAIAGAQRSLARAKKPTIAQIWGACVGGGCGLAIHCDFRYAATTSKFAITPAKLGIVYPLSDTKQLVDLIGPSKAKSILFTGRMFNAEEAFSMGLVDGIYAASALEDYVLSFAQELSSASQYSIQHMKQFIQRVLEGQAQEDADTAAIFRDAQLEEDAAEGLRAFLEKRPPNFKWTGS